MEDSIERMPDASDGVPSHVTTSLELDDPVPEGEEEKEEEGTQRKKLSKKKGGSLSEVYKRQHEVIRSSRQMYVDRQNSSEQISKCAQALQPLDKAYDKFQEFRYHCGVIVNSEAMQFFIVYLIAINAIMMGIGTFDFVRNNPKVDNAFELVDTIFLVIFTVELGMQFAFYGWRLILDGWLVFDLVIITLSWAFAQVQIIRAFRIFRAFRLITRIKVLKNLVLGKWMVGLKGVIEKPSPTHLLFFSSSNSSAV